MSDVDDTLPEPVTLDSWRHLAGPFFHGTRAVLAVGDEVEPGRVSNFHAGRVMNHVYFTALMSTAAWGAQLSAALAGTGDRGFVYEVEPTGPFEDDPNVTDKRFPGNPTRSYRSRHPLRVVSRVEDWPGRDQHEVDAMLASLRTLRQEGRDVIED